MKVWKKLRKQLAPVKYERVNPLHSWNLSHLISNFFLFQLQRHSDRHTNAIKRYQVDHYQVSLQLSSWLSNYDPHRTDCATMVQNYESKNDGMGGQSL